MMRPRQSQVRLDRSRTRLRLALAGTLLLIGVAVALLVAAGRLMPTLDPLMCPPADRVAGEVLLILDSTDPWTPIRLQALQADIRAIRDQIPRFARLRIHVVRESTDDGGESSAVLTICNPGSAEQTTSEVPKWLGWFVTNPARLEQRWEREFASAVDSALRNVGRAAPQDRSPIMETIRAAALAASDPNGPLVFILSDMYQNSDLFSVYGMTHVPRALADSLADVSVLGTRALAGARVRLYLLTPAGGEFLDRNELVLFWEEFFRAQGAVLKEIHRVEG